jgi:hypothetical protein
MEIERDYLTGMDNHARISTFRISRDVSINRAHVNKSAFVAAGIVSGLNWLS